MRVTEATQTDIGILVPTAGTAHHRVLMLAALDQLRQVNFMATKQDKTARIQIGEVVAQNEPFQSSRRPSIVNNLIELSTSPRYGPKGLIFSKKPLANVPTKVFISQRQFIVLFAKETPIHPTNANTEKRQLQEFLCSQLLLCRGVCHLIQNTALAMVVCDPDLLFSHQKQLASETKYVFHGSSHFYQGKKMSNPQHN